MLDLSRRELLIAGLAVGGSGIALGASGCRLVSAGRRPADEYTVGAIGIFPNAGEKFEGELPEVALSAAIAKINVDGGLLGKPVIFRGAQAGTEDEAFEGFRRLEADPTVVGIILTTQLASDRIIDEAAAKGLPLITTASDLAGAGAIWPGARERRSIFQFALPHEWVVDVLSEYCRSDRGYGRVALLYDDFTFPNIAKQFAAGCAAHGLEVVRAEQFGRGQQTLTEQVGSFGSSGSHAFFVWADPRTIGNVAIALKESGADYVDVATARSPAKFGWHPQVFGPPEGMAERDWALIAASAATVGSITAADIGAFRKGPEWLPEEWGERFAPEWDRKDKARRGVRAVIDSAWALVEAARRAGTTDRLRVVEGLETGRNFKFASTTFGFSSRDHLALTRGDVALMTLERSTAVETNPPYSVGTEWREGLAVSPDMTLLIRPRQGENLEAQPTWTSLIIRNGYGTQCTREPNGSLSKVCRIH